MLAYRFIFDSRDRATEQRLDDLGGDPYRLFRCRTIMNCAEVCPKGLEPVRAIEAIRLMLEQGSRRGREKAASTLGAVKRALGLAYVARAGPGVLK